MVANSSPGTLLSQSNIPAEYRPDYVSFWSFIFKNKSNKRYLLIAAIATVLQFIVFKILYPYADFFGDSYSYLYAAEADLSINIWPIGYSWFLRYIHFITHSDTVVVAIQYFFLILSSLVFFFTIQYFFKPRKSSTNILYIGLFFNPLFLYISNYINSDPLFAALSLLWIAQLIWIIHRPMMYQVLTHAILLYLCFIVRNNAMVYPFISIIAFLLSNHRTFLKWAGIGLGSILVLLFVNHQRNAANKVIGQKEFSLFTGWQLANNALYAYNHVEVDSSIFKTKEAADLNRYAATFFKTTVSDIDAYLPTYVANFFIRENKAPLKKYYYDHYKAYTQEELIVSWSKAGLVYKDFGETMIKTYPVAYFRHFVLLNLKHFFIPPLEKLDEYNLGSTKVDKIAQTWFDYKSNRVKSVSSTAQGYVLGFYPSLFMFLNICIIGFIFYLLGKRYLGGRKVIIDKGALIAIALLVLNMIFLTSTTIIVFRYQFLPAIISLWVFLYLLEQIDTLKARAKSSDKQIPISTVNTAF